jgi:hypothetical protein
MVPVCARVWPATQSGAMRMRRAGGPLRAARVGIPHGRRWPWRWAMDTRRTGRGRVVIAESAVAGARDAAGPSRPAVVRQAATRGGALHARTGGLDDARGAMV